MLGLQEKIKGVSKGDIPHSADALILLLQRIQSLQISSLPEPAEMEPRSVSPCSEVLSPRFASPILMSKSGVVSHANRPGRRR